MSSCLFLYLYIETCTIKGGFISIYLYTRPACSSLGHFDKCISNQVPLRTVFIYWIHPSADYTFMVSTG